MNYYKDDLTPDIFHDILQLDFYNKADRKQYASTTQLLKEPLDFHIEKRYKDKMTIPSIRNLWSVYGSAIHLLFEKAMEKNKNKNKWSFENRYYCIVEDPYNDGKLYRISGEPDMIDIEKGILYDYKITNTYSISIKETIKHYTQQLNIYRYILHKNNIEINQLKILYILRNWVSNQAKKKDYPQSPIGVLDIDLWTMEDTEKFIAERLSLLSEYDNKEIKDIPICSNAYRWNTTSYAVIKDGNTRASAVFSENSHGEDFELHAKIYAEKDEKFKIEKRESGSRKCMDWCNSFQFCPYKEEIMLEVKS
jgi:hypothetical protein